MVDKHVYLKLQQDMNELVTEYVRLKRFEEAILKQQPFKAGDRIVLTREVLAIDYNKSYGWKGYQEMLKPGNTGTILGVGWNDYWKYWYATIQFDVEWHLSETHNMVWIEDPARHSFMMPFEYLRLATIVDDEPILPPRDKALTYEVTSGAPDYAREQIEYKEVLERYGKVKVS